MDNREWLNTSIEISKLMKDPCIEDGYLVGECILSLDLLTMLQALKAENHFLDTGKVLKGGVGLSVKLSIEVPRTESVFFGSTWDDLLAFGNFLWSSPGEYYVLKQEGNAYDSNYKNIIRVIKALAFFADHQEGNSHSRKLIFLGKSKLELVLFYSDLSTTLLESDLKIIEEFSSLEDKHKTHRSAIIKASLAECVASESLEVRLSALLKKFSTFIGSIEHGYALYVSEFSYEKAIDEANKSKLDFHIRINKIIGDMQSQLLTIPAAFIFLGSQYKESNQLNISTVSLLVGAIIFGVLMDILVRNQKDSVEAIMSEVSGEMNRHIRVNQKIRTEIESIFKPLIGRVSGFRLKIFLVEVSVSLVIAFAIFLVFSNISY